MSKQPHAQFAIYGVKGFSVESSRRPMASGISAHRNEDPRIATAKVIGPALILKLTLAADNDINGILNLPYRDNDNGDQLQTVHIALPHTDGDGVTFTENPFYMLPRFGDHERLRYVEFRGEGTQVSHIQAYDRSYELLDLPRTLDVGGNFDPSSGHGVATITQI